MDSTSGLLVGSLAYRMRGKGLILALYGGQQPHLEMSQSFNLTTEELAIIQVHIYFLYTVYLLFIYCTVYLLV